MTSEQDFTDQEWTRIRRAPLVAGAGKEGGLVGGGAERVRAGDQRMLDQVGAAVGMAC